jgi:hypothetical protein
MNESAYRIPTTQPVPSQAPVTRFVSLKEAVSPSSYAYIVEPTSDVLTDASQEMQRLMNELQLPMNRSQRGRLLYLLLTLASTEEPNSAVQSYGNVTCGAGGGGSPLDRCRQLMPNNTGTQFQSGGPYQPTMDMGNPENSFANGSSAFRSQVASSYTGSYFPEINGGHGLGGSVPSFRSSASDFNAYGFNPQSIQSDYNSSDNLSLASSFRQ